MLYSYVGKTVAQGGWSGVPRFDRALAIAFPEMISVTQLPEGLTQGDVVITDNHLSLFVPENIPTVVVHHGCAATHFERDPQWRTDHNLDLVHMQGQMFSLSNRTYVAPSQWVAGEFRRQYGLGDRYRPLIIPHYVAQIGHYGPAKDARPVVIGDWRDWNKGADLWRKIAAACPEMDFAPLNFQTEKDRIRTYSFASAYLCLSVSEGGSYSVCDAEATGLPLVTTDVGNCREFQEAVAIPWPKRGDTATVVEAIRKAIQAGRRGSFYDAYSSRWWSALWHSAVEQARTMPQAAVLC